LDADQAEPLFFQVGQDRAGLARGDRVRLQNRECPFQVVSPYCRAQRPSISLIFRPMSAGDFTTPIPAAARACIFSPAVPLPPAMIAPACPMRRPGGAVWPAMNDTTGF